MTKTKKSCNIVQKLIVVFSALDIHPTKIYFSNTTKVSSHMKASIARGVDLMIFNSLHELNKIQKVAPKARLILSLENYCGSRR